LHYADADINCYCCGHTNCYFDANSDSYTFTHCYTHTDSKSNTNSEAAADAAISPDSGASAS
jgi:hypothetical protein